MIVRYKLSYIYINNIYRKEVDIINSNRIGNSRRKELVYFEDKNITANIIYRNGILISNLLN